MRLIGIYSRNRYEWFITDWACIQFGLTSVPLYDTLGVENLTYCLHQTKLTTVFATPETISILLKLSDLGALHTIISYDPVD
jgi:long-chain acyl-CoA synthetase